MLSGKGNNQAMPTPQTALPYSLACSYSTSPLEQIIQQKNLLVAINYNAPCLPTANPKQCNSGLNQLGEHYLTELWTTNATIDYGSQDNCHWSQTDELLFVSLVTDESRHVNQQQAIEQAYQRLLILLEQKGYPHIIRAWNYMEAINDGFDDDERYRHFCIGRQQAFTQHHYSHGQYPSACALGHHQGQTIVYLLAAKQPGVHFENPNQQSAYQYPRQYGPQSPSFARATLANWQHGQQLFISGTASIIGHQSILGDPDNHSHNLSTQINTTLANIDQLLVHVADQRQLSEAPRPDSLKVYIRHSTDYPAIKSAIEQHYGNTPALYLEADICRRELLLEIDALCEL